MTLSRLGDNKNVRKVAGDRRSTIGAHPRIVIIGAGIGGLAAALDAAARGYTVTVLERAADVGGKMRIERIGDAGIDAGPTVFTMRWVFEGLFADAGERLADRLDLTSAQTLASHAWDLDERLDLFADRERSADAIGEFAGAAERRGYLAFCARAREIYDLVEGPFIRSGKAGTLDLMRTSGLKSLSGIFRSRPVGSLWQALGQHFKDARLRQLFARYATYVGSSPYQAPALLMLIAHVEQEGVWTVDGGMHRVAQVFKETAEAKGASFRFESEVQTIRTERGRVAGVVLASGEAVPADAVICNADVNAMATGLFGDGVQAAAPKTPASARSLSALTLALHCPAKGFPLGRHNVFFSNDYQGEFNDLFKRRQLPAMPTVYVCAQDRAEPEAAIGDRAERFLLLVNAPATGDRSAFRAQEIEPCLKQTFQLLERCGLNLEPEEATTRIATPATFEGLFPATGGALYGAANHGLQASLKRPGGRTKLPGLYLAGGSVHPGPGIPMATLSGRIAVASLAEDRASTRRSRPVVMPGGTSTA